MRYALSLFLLVGLHPSAAVAWQSPATTPTVPDATCAGCHDSHEKLKTSAHSSIACASCHLGYNEEKHPEGMQKPACQSCHTVIVQQYERSIHAAEAKKGAGPDCATCHGDKHEIARSKTAEAQRAAPENCGMCHDKAFADWKTSIHGSKFLQGSLASPGCTGCHAPHLVLSKKDPESRVNSANIPDTCGRCHGNLQLMARFGLNTSQVASFNQSFHGLALRSGLATVAECASCHGHHTILPSSDPKSTIHPNNIAATCGSCHPGAARSSNWAVCTRSISDPEPPRSNTPPGFTGW